MKRIVAYYRSSTKEQHYSIDVQRNQMHEFIKRNSFELVAEYQEQHSGKDKTRIQLANAIQHCINESCTLSFTKLDRLSRRASHLYQIKESGLDLICLDMPQLNTLSFGLYAMLAEHERELISQRTSSALQVVRQYKKLGNPYGWSNNRMIAQIAKKEKRNEWLKSNDVQMAKNIIQILSKNSKVSLCEIARNLNLHNIKTQRGKLWEHSQVKTLLKEL